MASKQANSRISLILYKFSSFAFFTLFFLALAAIPVSAQATGTPTPVRTGTPTPTATGVPTLLPTPTQAVPTQAQAGNGNLQYATDANGNALKDVFCTFRSKTSQDVDCRCPKSACRVSDGSKFSCIKGTTNVQYYLGQDDQLNAYTDVQKYKELFSLASNVQVDPKKSLYLDLFNYDTTQSSIPAGSFCKVHQSDQTGVAYWYYPGYFNILQGKDPFDGLSNNANPAVGGTCPNQNVLFGSKDLFGNDITGTQTFFGCLPNSQNGVVAFIVRLVSGLAIFVAFVIGAINFAQIVGNPTNSDLIQESQKKMFAAFGTLIGILLVITILNILGLQIIGFGSDGFGGSIFRFFVGGQ